MRLRIWIVCFGVFTLLGVCWAFSSPMMSVPDEPAQTVRAVSVVRGELIGKETIVREHDPNVLNIIRAEVTVPKAYATLDQLPGCYAFYPNNTADCSPPVSSDTSPAIGSDYMSRYPPLYYLAVGWPSLVLPPGPSLWAMRIWSAMMSAAFLATAVLALLELPRRRLAVSGLALAITPQVLFISAAVNPSGFEISAAIATWLSTLALVQGSGPPSRSLVVRTAVCAGLFALCRPLSPALVLFIVAVVWLTAGSRERARELWADRMARRVGAAFLAVFVFATGWIVVSKAYDSLAGYPVTDQTSLQIARYSLDQFPWRARQMIGVFGWLDAELHPVAPVAWYLAIGVVVGFGLVLGRWRGRLGILSVLAALVVLPMIAEVQAAEKVGTVWQGRYSLPLAVGVPILAAVVADSSGRVPRVFARAFGIVSALLIGTVYLVSFSTSVRRYATGADFGLFEYLRWYLWAPRPGQWLTFAASLTAVVLFVVVLVVGVLRETAPVDGAPPDADTTDVAPGAGDARAVS